MTECANCGKPVNHKAASGKPMAACFCNMRCRTAYYKATGFLSPSEGGSLAARKKRQKLVERARRGDPEAQAVLRLEGVRGLWNPETKEMVRF